MPRPKRPRRIRFLPGVTYFKPQGIPLRILEEVGLTVDELEAIRLADTKDLGQIKAAKEMGVSQSTFQRILSSAHRKVGEALIEGKALRVEGGEYHLVRSRWRHHR